MSRRNVQSSLTCRDVFLCTHVNDIHVFVSNELCQRGCIRCIVEKASRGQRDEGLHLATGNSALQIRESAKLRSGSGLEQFNGRVVSTEGAVD